MTNQWKIYNGGNGAYICIVINGLYCHRFGNWFNSPFYGLDHLTNDFYSIDIHLSSKIKWFTI